MPSHPKEPLIPTEAPLYPSQMVAADYFEVGTRTHHYLVYVDRYSGWNRTTVSYTHLTLPTKRIV